MEYIKIGIHENQIEYETARAYLVKMPNNGEYSGEKFWIAKKMCHDHGWYYICSIGKGWNITLSESGDIDTEELAEEFKEQSNRLIHELEKEEDSYLLVSEPKKVDKEVVIRDELKK